LRLELCKASLVAKKLYVGNLAYAVTDQDLKDLFSESGTVESVAVISDKFSGQSKGFGFVEMADAAGAEAAIKTLDGTEFKGRNLKVNEAKPREGGGGGGPRGGGGGRGGDRSGGGGNRW
jgi:RNA recognition motif-containing protein